MLGYILLFTFLASIVSLFLVAILLLHKTLIRKTSFLLVSFAAGALLATGFMVTFQLGFVTSIAVFIHEIPHELGDFGILIHKGWGRAGVLWLNAATGLVSILGAIVVFYLGKQFSDIVPVLLSVAAANFIYLSATDLLPEIHHRANKNFAVRYTLSFFMGIFLIIFLIKILN